MVLPTIVVSILLLLMAMAHLFFGVGFARFLRKQDRDQSPGDYQPDATVVLSLRGADPFLHRTIQALAAQDYPNYRIVIVIDHQEDPSWRTVNEIACEYSDVAIEIQELVNHRDTCSLKCSSIVQAVESLPNHCEVVVLADADVVPHSTWLRELVQPLEDGRVGIATGNQWFRPTQANLGSMVRAVWNAGAVVPTAVLGHPWAGSCAMRVEDVKRSGLIEEWKQSIVDDGPITRSMNKLGLKTKFLPSVFMINQEHCQFTFCWTYIRRMLTWSRLFESTYPLTVLHAIVLEGVSLLAIVLLCGAIFSGDFFNSMLLGSTLGFFWLANVIAYAILDAAVGRFSHAAPISSGSGSTSRLIWSIIAVPLTHFIYAFSAIGACFARQVKWREITYRIDRSGKVKMLEYSPYRDNSDEKRPELSL